MDVNTMGQASGSFRGNKLARAKKPVNVQPRENTGWGSTDMPGNMPGNMPMPGGIQPMPPTNMPMPGRDNIQFPTPGRDIAAAFPRRPEFAMPGGNMPMPGGNMLPRRPELGMPGMAMPGGNMTGMDMFPRKPPFQRMPMDQAMTNQPPTGWGMF